MNKKQILNEEFLKSIESEYVFSDKPLKRIKSEDKGENIKLKLENLKKKNILNRKLRFKKKCKTNSFW